MTNTPATSVDQSAASPPVLQHLAADPLPGHCGLRRRHLRHRFVGGDPEGVYRCHGGAVPPVGTLVREEDPHWLARAGVGAPW